METKGVSVHVTETHVAPSHTNMECQDPSTKIELWVGYELGGRRFIDKRPIPGDAQQKMVHLRAWWDIIVPRRTQIIMRIIMCQTPVLAIGTMALAPLAATENQYFPHETQFQTLERSELLTRGFAHPHTLVDEADFFERDKTFEVCQEATESAPGTRHVLFVGTETNKRLLAFPLALALLLSAIVAVVVGGCTKNVATGAQVGGTVGGCIAVVLGYIIWRLS